MVLLEQFYSREYSLFYISAWSWSDCVDLKRWLEFNLQVVFVGTKLATRTFKDGDFLEVDAHKGMVRKLR